MRIRNAEIDDNILFIHRRKKVLHIGENWRRFLRNLDLSAGVRLLKKTFTSETPKDFQEILFDLLRKKYDSSASFYHRDLKYNLNSQYIAALKSHLIILDDVTRQEYIKQLQHWAMVAQRLAHGIKNPLTTVKLNAEELKYQLHHKYNIDNDEINGFIESIINQVNRLKKMSDGFMRFVEFDRPHWQSVDLNKELDEKVQELKANISNSILIELDLEKKLPRIKIDKEQFFHALSSVFYNAVESIDGKGKIIISTSKANMISDNSQLLSHSSYILLQIRDTGCGIPAEFLDKATQPFFSRNKTEGTGLGLSIVQKIVEMHGGKLEIHSEVNQGTLVSIWLPINEK